MYTFLLKVLLFFLLVLNINVVQGQDYVEGEILIQLKPKTEINSFLEQFNQNKNLNSSIKMEKEISNPLRIYKLSFDHNFIDGELLISEVNAKPQVEHVQFNHKLKLRDTIPNDPQFDEQWQYNNTGQTGGVVGADLDADLAWEKTTGGLTTQNDTIVVCVIDGGFQISHPDLAANVWFNQAEIQGNGIDDDNNGFIDDYRGWNTLTQNDDVTNGDDPSHGTAVAGVIGAVGNNDVGVAGVNWNIKLMLVSGGTGLESEVLEAYSYAYQARRKYNETNGAEGAFVVSTNASWGVDGGQASEAPIWCSFYDSLGVIGILNAGATINGNQDVDIFGDLPTTCPSEYLVSVTNINDNDEKEQSAGFSSKHIDIGAFGQGIWTLTDNSSYGDFGGTSGATPHVAGAIALLYSAQCDNFIEIAKQSPAFAALTIRDHILSGGDPNASLEGITTTGKRLNLNNSLDLLLDNCTSCPNPISLGSKRETDVQAELSWITSNSSSDTNLRWRIQGTTNWTVEENVSSPFTLTDLEACTSYEFEVNNSCASITSDFSDSFVFVTDGCCVNPELSIQQIDSNSTEILWESILAADIYNLTLLDENGNFVDNIETMDTLLTFSNLTDCTQYQIQVQSTCDGTQIDTDDGINFTTLGCGACKDLEYCSGDFLFDSSLEWIESIEINGQLIQTGNNGVYSNFEDTYSIVLENGNSYDITLTPGFGDVNVDENILIWIDFNGDGLFDDTELILQEFSDAPVTNTFEIPTDAVEGLTKMRATLIFGNLENSCNWEFDPFGEIEDYCVNIKNITTATQNPKELSQISVVPNPFNESFQIVFGKHNYERIEIHNNHGVKMMEKAITNQSSVVIQDFKYPGGLYIISAFAKDGRKTRYKIIKTN